MVAPRQFIFLLAATALVLLATSLPAPAVQVQSVSSGGVTNVVFYDNYEQYPNNSEPVSPQVGLGVFGVSSSSRTFSNIPPGAAQGTNYLRLIRSPNQNPFFSVSIALDYGALSSASYTHVISSFSFYVPTGTNAAVFEVSMTPNLDTSSASFSSTPLWLEGLDVGPNSNTVGSLYTYVNGVYTDTGISFQKGVWNEMIINYSFLAGANNDTFSFAVNGNSSGPINAGGGNNVSDPANLRYLDFRTGDAGIFFLDAPEPSAAVLVGLAGLALWRRKRSGE